MDDGFLIHQVLGGNRNAFRMLVVRYQRPLFRFLAGFGVGRAVTEELAQEVFLRAFRSLSDFDPAKASFATWLFTIAKRLALNETARAGHRAPHLELDEHQVAALDAPSAQDSLEQSERAGRVQRALQALPENLRSTLLLAYLKELSLEQIAQIESCAIGTVKSRIFRGKALLRAALARPEEQT
jgi:RNA polymerase sigma-70 factor, ECF subfamily